MTEQEWQKLEISRKRKKHNEIKKFFKFKFKKASNFRVLSEADILWAGWECDSVIWLCQVDGKTVLVATNHSGYEIASKELLEAKAKEYIKLASIYFNWIEQLTNKGD